MEAEQYKNQKTYPCPEGCGRRFVKTSLASHAKMCKKIFQKKAKVFNTFQQRNNIDGVNLKKVNEKQLV